jgi:hypothetical protein
MAIILFRPNGLLAPYNFYIGNHGPLFCLELMAIILFRPNGLLAPYNF